MIIMSAQLLHLKSGLTGHWKRFIKKKDEEADDAEHRDDDDDDDDDDDELT